jgi:hypothetical protein
MHRAWLERALRENVRDDAKRLSELVEALNDVQSKPEEEVEILIDELRVAP